MAKLIEVPAAMTTSIYLRGSLVVALAAALTSCAVPGKKYINGGASASAKAEINDVRDNVIDVLREDSYSVASGYGDEMIFEKHGQKRDQLLYGGLFKPERTFERATVTLEQTTDETVTVKATSVVIRDEGGMQGEEQGWLIGNGRYRLQNLLLKACNRAEEEAQARIKRP